MNSDEKNPADVAFFKAPTDRVEGVLRNVNAALTARRKNISDILRTTNNSRKESDDESSEGDDFKSPKNTVKRTRKSGKTSEIETANLFENLVEEDIDDEDLHEDNHPTEDDKDVEGNRKKKNTTKRPAKMAIGPLEKREKISPLIIRERKEWTNISNQMKQSGYSLTLLIIEEIAKKLD
ncbi:hypothetical protein HHI36_009050 [Cryptolaemus montrouzieri]|uniref:Uncharacterized protein n=1 Tax=Cryptolaemus montrouzieri TaxID=559131 RepID=A0ABD2MUB1_9CUCU